MKTTILLISLFASSVICAQKTLGQLIPGSLYNSVEDFTANKPLPGYSVIPATWRTLLGKESIEVDKNGTKDRTKISELPAGFLTEVSQSDGGVLMRVFDKELYYVIESGKMCYYIKKSEAEVVELHGPSIYSKQFTSGKYVNATLSAEAPHDYYSEGITGEIKKLKESELEKRIEAKGLKSKYEADKPKREKKDNVNDWVTKEKLWHAKYIKMLNS